MLDTSLLGLWDAAYQRHGCNEDVFTEYRAIPGAFVVMINIQQQTLCKAGCGTPIQHIPGHRPKLYCSDRCRQRAHRGLPPTNVVTIVTNDEKQALEQRIAQLDQELAAANDLIDKLLSRKKTNNPLKRSYQDRLQRIGEKLDWPALDIHITVKPGRKAWRVFMINESNDQLIRAIIAAERAAEQQS